MKGSVAELWDEFGKDGDSRLAAHVWKHCRKSFFILFSTVKLLGGFTKVLRLSPLIYAPRHSTARVKLISPVVGCVDATEARVRQRRGWHKLDELWRQRGFPLNRPLLPVIYDTHAHAIYPAEMCYFDL
jgi:hypothetical protein